MREMWTSICSHIQKRTHGASHQQNETYALPEVPRKILAKESYKQEINKFQFVGLTASPFHRSFTIKNRQALACRFLFEYYLH